ncbi:MAG TPA: nuclear transport factor 2 family protein [Acidobacteriaceae bacterium]|nr:nuclear transport factor 2 family protein [Acidobacteriaceae bacterium]
MIAQIVAGAAAVLFASAAGAECTGVGQHRPQDLSYICKSESDWSQSVASGDTTTARRILAEDYVGIGSSGKRFIMADLSAQAAKTATLVTSSGNDYVHVRFFGHTAVNQGHDTIRSKDGQVSHLIWTDTWLKRAGKWQIVQSQDIEVKD